MSELSFGDKRMYSHTVMTEFRWKVYYIIASFFDDGRFEFTTEDIKRLLLDDDFNDKHSLEYIHRIIIILNNIGIRNVYQYGFNHYEADIHEPSETRALNVKVIINVDAQCVSTSECKNYTYRFMDIPAVCRFRNIRHPIIKDYQYLVKNTTNLSQMDADVMSSGEAFHQHMLDLPAEYIINESSVTSSEDMEFSKDNYIFPDFSRVDERDSGDTMQNKVQDTISEIRTNRSEKKSYKKKGVSVKKIKID